MKISVLTLFPEMFQSPFDHSIIKRAIEKSLIEVNYINIRDFGLGKHKTVDDKPYGGGKGMLLRVDVVHRAIEFAKDKTLTKDKEKIFLLDARGETFTQQTAQKLSLLSHLILVCGHYEGVDERIEQFIDGKISIGNYVLTGGEIPAMVLVDSVSRLVKGVLDEEATELESFSLKEDAGVLEHPQFTRPPEYSGEKVPEILTSGNHAEINTWKKTHSKKPS